MSAKSDEKHSSAIYFTEKQPSSTHTSNPQASPISYKRNKINTSEKSSKTSKEQKFYRGRSFEDEEDDNDAKSPHYAESKHDKRQRSSTEGALPVGKPLSDITSFESLDEIDEADREFQNLLRKPNEGWRVAVWL
jgi:hypothetical protein